ncbi:hypothetical protein PIB30_009920 [Stylosanthes scabra]|uniref:Uncharacterized protein n=1 Tax=Stylosanthes scabra TaxID=79078 RepID=A0ABU6S5B0_9FABA|nr:hypothetical protein [Stylosanthes scabra]
MFRSSTTVALFIKFQVNSSLTKRCSWIDTVEKPYSDSFRVTSGYRYREDVDKERKIGDFPGYSFLLILLLLLLPRDSRDSVADLMKTSPPTECILDIPGSTISQLRSIPLWTDRQRREAAVLDRANEEVLVPLDI